VTAEPLQRALGVALRYLNRRERTVAEMRQRLERDEHDRGVVAEALQTLIEQGLLDDERYARLFVEDKRMLEGWGEERVTRALVARGIDRELIDDALAAGDHPVPGASADTGESGELSRALAVLRHRFPAPPQDRRDRERAFAVLRRKGYSAEVAEQAQSQFAPSGSRYYDAA
jgi:regulatory protein